MTARKKRDSIHPSSERMEVITSGGNQLKQQFKPGDSTWIKIHGNSWWPAQVVDEKTVGNKPKKKAKDEILVRQYGTYEYLYMDPWISSSEFGKFLKKENCNAGEAFQKFLEEDLIGLNSAGKAKRKVSKSEENSTVDAPKGKKQKQDRMQRNPQAIQPVSVTEKAENKVSQGKCAGRRKEDRQDVARKAVNGGSKVEMMKRDCLRKLKRKSDKEERAEKDGDKISKHKTKKGKEGRSNVMENATDGVSEVKNVKQMGSRAPKHNDTKEHHAESPCSCGVPQQRGDLSARRTRVMQSLGLIAPLGSPFRRNGFVEAAVLKL